MMIRLVVFLVIFISTAYGTVYDCFMFFNEFEILEIRLNELYDHVDYFVLVEGAETHRVGLDKPYYFDEEKHRFAKFLDKIIHVKSGKYIEDEDCQELDPIAKAWARQNWHRNQIMQGLKHCSSRDLILISDVDEIIPGSIIPQLHQACLEFYPMIGFWTDMYRWFLNRSTGQKWAGTAALCYHTLLKSSPQEVRNAVRGAHMTMWHAGWHFTSMGGYEKAVSKYQNIVAGSDDPFPDGWEQWRWHVDAHTLVPIDSSYPEFVKNNIDYLIDIGLIDVPLY